MSANCSRIVDMEAEYFSLEISVVEDGTPEGVRENPDAEDSVKEPAADKYWQSL